MVGASNLSPCSSSASFRVDELVDLEANGTDWQFTLFPFDCDLEEQLFTVNKTTQQVYSNKADTWGYFLNDHWLTPVK